MEGEWECPACGGMIPDAEYHSCGKAGAVIERRDAARMTGKAAIEVADEMRTMLGQYEPVYDEKIVGVNCWQLRQWIGRLDPVGEV